MAPQDVKTRAIACILAQVDVGELRHFLGMVGYYRRFIPNFSAMVAPLNHLLKKTEQWEWGPSREEAFRELKCALMQEPFLRLPQAKQSEDI